MKRIGIFQYEWPLQIHTVNLARKLAENGFLVDLYFYQCEATFISLPLLASFPGVRVFPLQRTFLQRVTDRLMRRARKMLGLEYCPPDRMKQVVGLSMARIANEPGYDYFIGVEKKGLVWAGMLAEQLGTPYLYYSLEIHIEGHPAFTGKRDFVAIRNLERKYHAGAAATIIQDELRARALLESNGIGKADVIHIPVSVTGDVIRKKSTFLHQRLGIDPSKKIVLYIGQVRKIRGALELMECAGRLGSDFVMVLHGQFFADAPTTDDHGGKLFFSRDLINNEDIPEMVSSAHIGIAFYPNDIVNDRLTAFSSEKIAYYMQAGVPFIAYRNESYELLMAQHHCGEMVDRIVQLPQAVEKIAADYGQYRDAAFAAYEHFYSFDNNVHRLIEYLSRDD